MEGEPARVPDRDEPPPYFNGDKPPSYTEDSKDRPVFYESGDEEGDRDGPGGIEPSGEDSSNRSDTGDFCPNDLDPQRKDVIANEGGKDRPTKSLIWYRKPLGMALLSHRGENDTGAVVKQVYRKKDGLMPGLILHKVGRLVVDDLPFQQIARAVNNSEVPVEIVFYAQPIKIIDQTYNYKRGGETSSSWCSIL